MLNTLVKHLKPEASVFPLCSLKETPRKGSVQPVFKTAKC